MRGGDGCQGPLFVHYPHPLHTTRTDFGRQTHSTPFPLRKKGCRYTIMKPAPSNPSETSLSLEKFHDTFGALDKHLLGGFDALTLGERRKKKKKGSTLSDSRKKKTLIYTSSIVRSSAGRVLFKRVLVYFADGVTYILIRTHVHTHTTQVTQPSTWGGGGGIDTPNRVLTFHNWENVC